MLQATLKVSGSELTAELLEKIRGLFNGDSRDLEVTISVRDKATGSHTTANQFESLFQEWKAETALLSSGTAIVTHPAYQKIIQMGEAAVPFILIKLLEDPQHLFYALYKITGENPVLKQHAGNLTDMTADWMNWGKQKGYLN